MTGSPGFDAAERRAIVAEYERQIAERLPPNRGPVGGVLVLAAGAGFVALPALLRATGRVLPPVVRIGAMVAFAGLALRGIWLSLTASPAIGIVRARIAAALATLSGSTASAAERRAAAVTLVVHYFFSDGPGMTTTYEVPGARARLGSVTAYVEAVERVLREEPRANPVFTDAPPPAGG